MINKIGFSGSNSTNSINFTSDNLLEKFKQNTPYLTTNVNMSGNEALAAYNAPMVKEAPKPLDSSVDEFVIKDIPSPATLKGDEIETLSGDRILNSEGKLQAIRVKGEDTSKEYYFYKGKPASIITRDNNTGLPLRKDSFFNNNQNSYVIEFDKNGSPHRKFSFLDGKISDAKLIQDNKIISNDYFFLKDQLMQVSVQDTNSGEMKRYYLDENGKVEEIAEFTDENLPPFKRTSFKDGKAQKAILLENKSLKNPYNITPDNISLKPSNKVEKPDVSKLDGEKKFRSDNSLESITVKDGDKKVVYEIDLSGKNVEEINTFNGEKLLQSVSFDEDGSVFVRDFEQEKQTKTTSYRANGSLEYICEFNDKNEVSKTVDYSFDGKQVLKFTDNSNSDYGDLRMTFDKDKNLIELHNMNTSEKIYENNDTAN